MKLSSNSPKQQLLKEVDDYYKIRYQIQFKFKKNNKHQQSLLQSTHKLPLRKLVSKNKIALSQWIIIQAVISIKIYCIVVFNEQRERLKKMKDKLFQKGCNRNHWKENPSPQKRAVSPNPHLYERLAHPKNEIQDVRQQIKQKLEDKEVELLILIKQILEKCTFQPQISENSSYLANLKYSNYNADIVDRLSLLEKERQQHIEQLRAEKLQNELKQPLKQIQNYVFISEENQEPLHKRLAKVIKEKQNHLIILQQQELKKEEDLFHPNINPQSSILAQIKNDGENVIDRLTNHGIKRQQRLINASQVTERSFSEKYHFQPQTNKQRNEELLQDKADFLERQQDFQQKLTMKYSQLRQFYEQQDNCTFHPQVNQQSERIFSKNNNSNLVERLYEKEKGKKEQYIEEQETVFPFKPQLNQTSLQLALNRSLDDLISNDYAKQRNELLKSKMEEEQKQLCSFYPNLNENSQYSHLQSQYSFKNCADSIKAQMVEKERMRKQLLEEKEQAELQLCTFQPHINNQPIRKGNIDIKDVKGVESFLSNVDNREKKLKEKLKVEEKLFEIHKQYDYERHQQITKPQPFQVSQRQNREGYSKKKD